MGEGGGRGDRKAMRGMSNEHQERGTISSFWRCHGLPTLCDGMIMNKEEEEEEKEKKVFFEKRRKKKRQKKGERKGYES